MRKLVLVAAVVAFATTLASAGRAAAPPGLPADWVEVSAGPAGGSVWAGRILNQFAVWDERSSAIYLPPGYDPARRYPVVYLLHGLAGSPSSFWDSLRIAAVADELITSGRAQPFVAVMPVGGPIVDPNQGEWAGAWEQFVVHDVVPWVDSHLSTIPGPQGRALEGLCAGGFGAVDIGLRHPGVFGTLGSWEGYFAPVFRDGPFVHATRAELAAHDPVLLVRNEAGALRRDGVRFYISVGGDHGEIRRAWSIRFARELRTLHLQHELWLLPSAERGHFWRSTVPSALAYAAGAFHS